MRVHRSPAAVPASLALRAHATSHMEPRCSDSDPAEPWPDWSTLEPMVVEEYVEPRRDRDQTRYVARKAGVPRRLRLVDTEDTSGGSMVSRPGNGSPQSKRARDALFAQWIVDNLPLPPIEKQRYIIDVAGGRGALSLHLSEKHGRRCIVIDPRDLSSSSRSANTLGRTKRERRSMKLRGERLPMPFEQRHVSTTNRTTAVCCGLSHSSQSRVAPIGVVRCRICCTGARAAPRSGRNCRYASGSGYRAHCRRWTVVLQAFRCRAMLCLPGARARAKTPMPTSNA